MRMMVVLCSNWVEGPQFLDWAQGCAHRDELLSRRVMAATDQSRDQLSWFAQDCPYSSSQSPLSWETVSPGQTGTLGHLPRLWEVNSHMASDGPSYLNASRNQTHAMTHSQVCAEFEQLILWLWKSLTIDNPHDMVVVSLLQQAVESS
jgi:hypothetical protein